MILKLSWKIKRHRKQSWSLQLLCGRRMEVVKVWNEMSVLGKGCWRFYKGASCVGSWEGRWYRLLNGNRAEGWISGVQSWTYYMWDACEKYENIESNISIRSMEPWMELEIGIWIVCLTVVLKAVAMREITKESVWPKRTRWSPGDLNIKILWTNNQFYLTSPKELPAGVSDSKSSAYRRHSSHLLPWTKQIPEFFGSSRVGKAQGEDARFW